MSVRFDPRAKLILVRAIISGPPGRANLRLALDTGATRTTIDPARLRSIGIEPDPSSQSQLVTTASGIESVCLLVVPRLEALGIRRHDIEVLAHRLPGRAPFDGMLGLDVLRGRRLLIDFASGTIDVE